MRLILIGYLFCSFLFAAEVIRVGSDPHFIAASQDLTRQWQVKDRVCVVQNGKEIDCGAVVKSKEKFFIIKLKEGNSLIGRGDKVVIDTRSQKAAALIQPEVTTSTSLSDSMPFHMLSLSGSLGLGFFYPSIHFQRIIDPQVAMGLMPSYLNINTSAKSLSSISLLVTGNYYPDSFFKGIWIQAGAGVAFMSTKSGTMEQQSASFEALATLGYHFQTEMGLVLGIAGGLHYLHDPSFSGLTLNGVGFKPLAILDVGVNF
jgi:hypothetical protein